MQRSGPVCRSMTSEMASLRSSPSAMENSAPSSKLTTKDTATRAEPGQRTGGHCRPKKKKSRGDAEAIGSGGSGDGLGDVMVSEPGQAPHADQPPGGEQHDDGQQDEAGRNGRDARIGGFFEVAQDFDGQRFVARVRQENGDRVVVHRREKREQP